MSAMFRNPPPIASLVSALRARWRVLLLMSAALVSAGALHAQTPREYDLKAAFLYNFATFTEWPVAAFAAADAPFVIGVLGDDPFGPILDQIVKGEYVGQHPIVVARYKRAEDPPPCHILFISRSESRRTHDLIRQLQGQPVLTVADMPNFAENGGSIGFITTGNVGLKINPATIQESKLNISSKLLRLAKLVSGASAPQ